MLDIHPGLITNIVMADINGKSEAVNLMLEFIARRVDAEEKVETIEFSNW